MTVLRIGLTGGIASGKSQVADLFRQKNISVIDADQIARSLFEPGSPLLTQLKTHFGHEIFNPDATLNRKALRELVFSDPEQLKWLNALTHPRVNQEIQTRLKAAKSPYVIIDIPLLVNTQGEIPAHLQVLIDRVLLVDTALDQQIARLCARDKIAEAEARKVIALQSSLAQKLAHADEVIDNNASLDRLAPQVETLHQFYLSLCQPDES